MLGKLLKYEFKATGRTIIPLYGALLFFALILRIFVVNTLKIDNNTFSQILKVLCIFLYGATMAATAVATLLIIIQRFYKNLLGDEGYLMNTLPVSIDFNIISKLTASIIWCIVSLICAVVSILILSTNTELIPHFIDILKDGFNHFGINVPILMLEFFIAFITQIALNIILIYAAMSLGHLLPKMKILGAFGAYLGLTTVMTIIITTVGRIIFSSQAFNNMMDNLVQQSSIIVPHLAGIGSAVINIIWFAVFYIITHYILKNKLNLE